MIKSRKNKKFLNANNNFLTIKGPSPHTHTPLTQILNNHEIIKLVKTRLVQNSIFMYRKIFCFELGTFYLAIHIFTIIKHMINLYSNTPRFTL